MNTSGAINLLRFPLALLVIFIHTATDTTNINVIASAAVPTFFFISGYLYFLNIDQFTWNTYRQKTRKRLHSLIIPYLLWNLLAFLCIVIKLAIKVTMHRIPSKDLTNYVSSSSWHIFWDYGRWGEMQNLLGWTKVCTGPVDIPLWFLRDLIIVSLAAPIIYWMIKKLRFVAILGLFAIYASSIGYIIQGLSPTAFFFFGLGAYFSLNNIDVVSFASKIKYSLWIVFAFMLIPCIYYDSPNTMIGDAIHPFLITPLVLLAFVLVSAIRSERIKEWTKRLNSSCFFIYAAHMMMCFIFFSPVTLSQKLFLRILPFENSLCHWISYLLTAILTTTICVILYYLAERFIPRTCKVLSGNRTSNKHS